MNTFSFIHDVFMNIGFQVLYFIPLTIDDFFSSIGKIYVVVAVIVVIFIALMIYLWRMDNRLTNLEKQINDSETRGS